MTSSAWRIRVRPSTAPPVETFCHDGRWVVRSEDVVLVEFATRADAIDAARAAAIALRTDSVVRYAVARHVARVA